MKIGTKSMKILVGKYLLGSHMVSLYLEAGLDGASFNTVDPKNGTSQISLGLDHTPAEMISVLLHEALEMTISLMNGRYQADYCVDKGTDRYAFFLNHQQFSETCSRVGHFMSDCVPDILKVFVEAGKNNHGRLPQTTRKAQVRKPRKARSKRKT